MELIYLVFKLVKSVYPNTLKEDKNVSIMLSIHHYCRCFLYVVEASSCWLLTIPFFNF